MKLFNELIGNEFIKKTLAADIYNGTASHAYILEGPEGSGRHKIAYLAAAALVCNNKNSEIFPCGECSACIKTKSKSAADISVIGCGDRQTIGVDTIRENIISEINYAPVEFSKKIYIIEQADKMTSAAQNSLLLSLEEPPEFVVFFLLCSDSSLLLETVRSRAQILKTESFSNDFIKNYIENVPEFKQYTVDRNKFQSAVSMSHGAIGKAIELLKSDNKEHQQITELCKEAVSTLGCSQTSQKLAILSKFPNDRDTVINMLECMRFALGDLATVKKCKKPTLCFYSDIDEAFSTASRISTKKISEIEYACRQAVLSLKFNLSVQSSLVLLATSFNRN